MLAVDVVAVVALTSNEDVIPVNVKPPDSKPTGVVVELAIADSEFISVVVATFELESCWDEIAAGASPSVEVKNWEMNVGSTPPR